MLSCLLLAGCAGSPFSAQLVVGGGSSAVCVRAEPAQQVAIGEIVRAVDAKVVIEQVSLVGADGLELVDAFFVPMANRTTVGSAYPETDPPAGWEQRTPAVGSRVPSGATENLVVTVLADDGAGTAESVQVTYRDDWGTHTVDGTMSYELADRCG